MGAPEFIDYYAVLEIRPDTNSATLGRVFRNLAQRYHPDNADTGDRLRFDLILESYNTLKDPSKRAQYDTQYQEQFGPHPKFAEEVSDSDVVEQDVEIQDKLLSIYYFKRRHNVGEPGVPEFELERRFERPIEQLEFHLWFLREKGWVEFLDNGMMAITIQGIDHINAEHRHKAATKLLTNRHLKD